MSTGVWLYPHDLDDVPGLAEQLRDADVDVVCLMASYHSLVAAVPANPTRQAFGFESSAVYFQPDPAVWRGAAVHPAVASSVAASGDALERGRRFAAVADAQLCAWLVCLHLDATEWPDPRLTVEAVTGDRIAAAPCLRAPEVRDYARRLVSDASARCDAVQLESLHWLAAPHGVHAKVVGAAPRLSSLAMSICFCARCRSYARERGVDADQVAAELMARWRAAWDGLAPDDPDEVRGLAGYLAARAATVTELVAEVASASRAPVEVVAFGDTALHGMDVRDVTAAGVPVRMLSYGSPAQVRTALTDTASAHVGLSILPEHVHELADARAAVEAAAAAGARSMRLYHAGLAGERRRGWVPELTAAWRGAVGAAS